MRRTTHLCAGFLQGIGLGGKAQNFFTSLWSKPETRDERVKEYVPEVLEESLVEQRAVLEETTSRDVVVELGHKILLLIENKSPTPSISPHLNTIMHEYGGKDLIAQRPLSYLLYPNAMTLPHDELVPELVRAFVENLRALVEEVERAGCSIKPAAETLAEPSGSAADQKSAADGEEERSSDVKADEGEEEASALPDSTGMRPAAEHEPLDVTMFIRVASGMALANLHCGDLRSAVRCVDAGLAHAVEPQRVGGLLGLKAGLLVRQKKFEEAGECARLAVEASGNLQGYLQGAYALRQLNRPSDVVALLSKGREDHPMDRAIADQLEAAQKEVKLALPSS